MEAICLAVPPGSIQVTGKDCASTRATTNDATRRPALRTGATVFVCGRSVHVPLVVLISLMEDADAQSVLAYGVDVQKYRAVLAQEGFNLIIARSCTELPLPYDAITSFPCIDTKQILPRCTYEQVQYLAMG